MTSMQRADYRKQKGYCDIETCLRRNKHIGCRLGIEQPTLEDIRIEMNVSVLRRDLKMLGIDDTITVNRHNALNILIQEYGFNVGTTLYGHWSAIQSMTHEQILQTGAKTRTIQDRNKRILDAGVSLTSTQGMTPLPPLQIKQGRNETAGSTSETMYLAKELRIHRAMLLMGGEQIIVHQLGRNDGCLVGGSLDRKN